MQYLNVDEKDRPQSFPFERSISKRRRSTANLTSTYDILLTMLHTVRTLPVLHQYIDICPVGKYADELLLALRLLTSWSLTRSRGLDGNYCPVLQIDPVQQATTREPIFFAAFAT
jgi:hypothetical protein